MRGYIKTDKALEIISKTKKFYLHYTKQCCRVYVNGRPTSIKACGYGYNKAEHLFSVLGLNTEDYISVPCKDGVAMICKDYIV